MLSLRELSTMLSSHPSSTPYFSKFSFSICRERERERGRHHDQLVIFKFKTIVLNSSFPLETINYTYYSFSPTEKLSTVTANVMINKSKILSMLSLYASISNNKLMDSTCLVPCLDRIHRRKNQLRSFLADQQSWEIARHARYIR